LLYNRNFTEKNEGQGRIDDHKTQTTVGTRRRTETNNKQKQKQTINKTNIDSDEQHSTHG